MSLAGSGAALVLWASAAWFAPGVEPRAIHDPDDVASLVPADRATIHFRDYESLLEWSTRGETWLRICGYGLERSPCGPEVPGATRLVDYRAELGLPEAGSIDVLGVTECTLIGADPFFGSGSEFALALRTDEPDRLLASHIARLAGLADDRRSCGVVEHRGQEIQFVRDSSLGVECFATHSGCFVVLANSPSLIEEILDAASGLCRDQRSLPEYAQHETGVLDRSDGVRMFAPNGLAFPVLVELLTVGEFFLWGKGGEHTSVSVTLEERAGRLEIELLLHPFDTRLSDVRGVERLGARLPGRIPRDAAAFAIAPGRGVKGLMAFCVPGWAFQIGDPFAWIGDSIELVVLPTASRSDSSSLDAFEELAVLVFEIEDPVFLAALLTTAAWFTTQVAPPSFDWSVEHHGGVPYTAVRSVPAVGRSKHGYFYAIDRSSLAIAFSESALRRYLESPPRSQDLRTERPILALRVTESMSRGLPSGPDSIEARAVRRLCSVSDTIELEAVLESSALRISMLLEPTLP